MDFDVYLGQVEELWVIDLETQTMYIANRENPKVLRLEPLEVEA